MNSNDLVPIDKVRRPPRQIQSENIEPGGSLANIDGWQILALMLEKRITIKQAQHVNSKRIQQMRGLKTRKAA